MNRRCLIAGLLAMPIVAGLASVAEVAMRPAKPSQMQAPSVRVIKSVPAPAAVKESLTVGYAPQSAASAAMYRQLNADITSGRRAATKSGISDREPIEGVDYWVIDGPAADAWPAEPFELVDLHPDYSDIAEPAVDQIADIRTPDFYRDRIGGYCCEREIIRNDSVGVPEPAPLALLAAGIAALMFFRRAGK